MQDNPVEMKLEIELVPKTSWWNNLRKSLTKSEWDKIFGTGRV